MLVVIGLDYADLWRWEDFDPSPLSSLMCSFHAPWWVVGARRWSSGWGAKGVPTRMSTSQSLGTRPVAELHEALGWWAGDGAYDRGGRWRRLRWLLTSTVAASAAGVGDRPDGGCHELPVVARRVQR